jgi:hypothetical protein
MEIFLDRYTDKTLEKQRRRKLKEKLGDQRERNAL